MEGVLNMLCHNLETRNHANKFKDLHTHTRKVTNALVEISYESSTEVGDGFAAAHPFWGMDMGFV